MMRSARAAIIWAWAAATAIGGAGCGALDTVESVEDAILWGEHATLLPGWLRVGRAARDALLDVQTLIPTAGALLFAIDELDEEASDWAVDHNPVFGSRRSAKDFSDWANVALGVSAGATLLATPSGEGAEWWLSKGKGLLFEGGAIAASLGATEALSSVVHRRRPSGTDRRSFPSGHTATAFAFATLANRNLESIDLDRRIRVPLQLANTTAATLVGWARVEGESHYPSDVLTSAALSHFITAFVHDAFLGLPEERRFGFSILAFEGGAMASWSVEF